MAGNGPAPKTNDKGKNRATDVSKDNASASTPTTTRSRRMASQMTEVAASDIVEDASEEIRDAAAGKAYLMSNSYIIQDSDCTVSVLADTLLRVSTLNIPRTARSAIRAVALLLNEGDLRITAMALANEVNKRIEELYEPPPCTHAEHATSISQVEIDKITNIITRAITDRFTTELASIHKKITDSTSTLTASATRIADDTTSYREALLRHNPPTTRTPAPPIDPKIQARKDAQAKQLLIDFTDQNDRLKHRNTSLTSIVESANTALKEAGVVGAGRFVSAAKMANGGILLEGSDPTLISKVNEEATSQLFLDSICPSAVIRARTYNTVLYFTPLTFRAGNEQDLREIEETNGLTAHSIVGARWIKHPDRRRPTQVFGHAIVSFKDPHQANTAIANGLVVCQKRVNVAKDKKEPTRCMKCQKCGHMAIACISTGDTCGRCGGAHRTAQCSGGATVCTPCCSHGHASWDRSCPVFAAKCHEMDSRSLDNLVTYFPTEEPWTQVATKSPWAPTTRADPRFSQATDGMSDGHNHPHPTPAGRGRPQNRRPPTADPRPTQPRAQGQTHLPTSNATNTPVPFPTSQETATQASQPDTTRRTGRSLPPRGRQVNAVASSSRGDSGTAGRAPSHPAGGRMRQSTLPFRPSQRLTDATSGATGNELPTHSPEGWDLPARYLSSPASHSSDPSIINAVNV